MIFGLFDRKKKRKSLADLLSEFAMYQHLIGYISKAQSLQKLNRLDEAQQILLDAERMVKVYLNQNAYDKKALLMLVLFYSETGAADRAEPIIRRLLESDEFHLSDEESLVLSGQLLKIQRERPFHQRGPQGPKEFTQVYCCANCGRLHNFISASCPHCNWHPNTLGEMARSIVLSNTHFEVPALLSLAREIGKGRPPRDVVINLESEEKSYLTIPERREAVEQVFSMLIRDGEQYHHDLNMVRECSKCRYDVLFSSEERCEECGALLDWSDMTRTLVCLDNLLWLFERWVRVSPSGAFSDFVCVLVAMTNNLLRKQEVPSIRECQYALQLLTEMIMLSDPSNGAVIYTQNPKALQIYLVKENMTEDSETFGLFLLRELEFFVMKMAEGIRS